MVTLKIAKKLLDAAEKKATEIKVPMVITIMDAGARLVAQHRMDGALLASLEISKQKAYTAIALQGPTHAFAEAAAPGGSLYGLITTDQSRLVVFGGGFPLKDKKGNIVGSIGVSGGSVEEDMTCAEAGVAAFKG